MGGATVLLVSAEQFQPGCLVGALTLWEVCCVTAVIFRGLTGIFPGLMTLINVYPPHKIAYIHIDFYYPSRVSLLDYPIDP
jgi:hypothetical protein